MWPLIRKSRHEAGLDPQGDTNCGCSCGCTSAIGSTARLTRRLLRLGDAYAVQLMLLCADAFYGIFIMVLLIFLFHVKLRKNILRSYSISKGSTERRLAIAAAITKTTENPSKASTATIRSFSLWVLCFGFTVAYKY